MRAPVPVLIILTAWAMTLDMPGLVAVATVEIGDLELRKHGLRVSGIVRAREPAWGQRLPAIFIHEIEHVRHGSRVRVLPFCKIVG